MKPKETEFVTRLPQPTLDNYAMPTKIWPITLFHSENQARFIKEEYLLGSAQNTHRKTTGPSKDGSMGAIQSLLGLLSTVYGVNPLISG